MTHDTTCKKTCKPHAKKRVNLAKKRVMLAQKTCKPRAKKRVNLAQKTCKPRPAMGL